MLFIGHRDQELLVKQKSDKSAVFGGHRSAALSVLGVEVRNADDAGRLFGSGMNRIRIY